MNSRSLESRSGSLDEFKATFDVNQYGVIVTGNLGFRF
jgi:hypothetical protein